MTSSKSTSAEEREAEARTFIRLQLGGEVARAASHIRSKRAAALRVGIEESRAQFQGDYGSASVRAFLECVEGWLTERGNMVAAAALRAYLESDPVVSLLPTHAERKTAANSAANAAYLARHREVGEAGAPSNSADASIPNRQPPSASRSRRADTSRIMRSYRSSRSH